MSTSKFLSYVERFEGQQTARACEKALAMQNDGMPEFAVLCKARWIEQRADFLETQVMNATPFCSTVAFESD